MKHPQQRLSPQLMVVGRSDWRKELQRRERRRAALIALLVLVGACIYAIVALCLR
jgi:hypothetical protein